MAFFDHVPFVQPLLRRDTVNTNETVGARRWVENKDTNGVFDGTYHMQIRLYNATGGSTVIGNVYVYTHDATVTKQMTAITIAAVANTLRYAVVAMEVILTTAFGWFACFGFVDAMVNGTTDLAANDYIKLVAATSTTAFIQDGTAHSTLSLGRIVAALTTNADTLVRVLLFGDPATIA